MNKHLKQLIEQLPESEIRLDDNTKKKIHRLIPVPSDYTILWADIVSFGGYPAGIVITEQALIVKSSKAEVEKHKKEIKEENKGKNKNDRVQAAKVLYRIIPWEFYSPEEYSVEYVQEKGKRRYVFKAGENELATFYNTDLYHLFKSYNSNTIEQQKIAEEIIENSSVSAINSINVAGTMFNAAYGADQTRSGHGIYAEEAGVLLDIINGEKSTVVGRDNAKNGPDKIVDSCPVQCKYYKTAYGSINACFTKDAARNRVFRYYDLNGNPMKIEVPSDQYSQAIEYMKDSITSGKVEGVSDPNAAYDIIRKGKLSYSQALNLAKAGTIESLKFDAATGAITCLSALGISSVVTFAHVYWKTKDYKKAAKYALSTGIQVYGLSFAGGVIAAQLARTGAAKALYPAATSIVSSMDSAMVQNIVNAFRALAGKKSIYGIAAQKSFVKFLGSNAITEGVFFLVFSVPDIYRVIGGKISGAQYVKNMLSLVSSFVGATAAAVATGSLIGKHAGEAINKRAGGAIGLGVGALGGMTAGIGTKAIGNLVREDDNVITTRMFNAILVNMIINYMLSDEEQNALIELLDQDVKMLGKLQQSLLNDGNQAQTIEEYLDSKLKAIVSKRNRISEETEQNIYGSMQSIILNGELAYGM